VAIRAASRRDLGDIVKTCGSARSRLLLFVANLIDPRSPRTKVYCHMQTQIRQLV